MLCEEKATLLELYVLTVRRYSDAVSGLCENLLSPQNSEVDQTRAEEILQDLAAARMKFHAHLKEHGC
jgi:hypothetical protein